ncbi:MAG TPA: hypothetical protein VHA79_08215 [Mycobacteriales bacterium]|jgi:hypothetical protein|nr:hypothetical protein [Mycobacteriales bacterium]
MVARRLVSIASAVAIAAAVSGCNAAALSKREMVVHFDPSATTEQHRAALDACAHVTTAATPEPFSTTGPVSNQINNVRYRIDHANDRDIALLTTCLSKQPGVIGEDIPDLSN